MPGIATGVFEVCVFRVNEGEPQYLLLKRSDSDKLYPGIWQVVTGTVEEGEHTVQAALREVQEETNLKLQRLWAVPLVNSFYVARSDSISMSPFFAGQVGVGMEPRLSPEHMLYKWAPYAKAMTLIPWPGQRRGLELVHKFIVTGHEMGSLTELTAQFL
jgi:dATP pyrophosphohydrolase